MSEFRDAVAAAAAGTPYTVVDRKDGFDVQLDIANARWWELFDRAGLHKSFRWRVKERKPSFTITDRQVEVHWRGGVPGFGASVQAQGGRIVTFSREKIWALSDRGRIEPVVNYRFNSREGRDLIRMVGKQLGLKERMPLSIKIMWIFVLATPVGWAVIGLVLLVMRLLGHH